MIIFTFNGGTVELNELSEPRENALVWFVRKGYALSFNVGVIVNVKSVSDVSFVFSNNLK